MANYSNAYVEHARPVRGTGAAAPVHSYPSRQFGHIGQYATVDSRYHQDHYANYNNRRRDYHPDPHYARYREYHQRGYDVQMPPHHRMPVQVQHPPVPPRAHYAPPPPPPARYAPRGYDVPPPAHYGSREYNVNARAHPDYERITPRDTSYSNVQIPVNDDIFEGGSRTKDNRLWPPPCPTEYIRDQDGNLPSAEPPIPYPKTETYSRKVTFSAPTTANSSFQTSSSKSSYVQATGSKQAPKPRKKDPLKAFSPRRSSSGYDASTAAVKQPRAGSVKRR